MKRSRHIFVAAFALVAAAMLVAACGGGTAAPAATSAPAAQPAASGNPIAIKVGLLAPLSGPNKTFGVSTENAFNLAVSEANATGKVKITTDISDDKSDPTEGVNAATKEITQDQVKAIVGPVTSNVAIPVSDLAESNKVVMISSTATNPQVTVVNGKRKDYIFRACFIDPFQGQVMAKFVSSNLKLKTAAVMYDNSNDYSKGLAQFFQDNFKKDGGTITNSEAYNTNDTDFSAALTKIAASKPDFLYLPDYYQKVSLIAQEARQKGVTAVFGGGDGWDSPDLDMKAVDGGYFSNHYSAQSTAPEVQQWVSKYKAKYGSEPDALATLAYDGTNLLINAIETAGGSDPTKIRDAMQATKDFPAVTGKISFDKDGNPVKSAVIIQIKNGKQNFVTNIAP